MPDRGMNTEPSERAAGLWRTSDDLRRKARRMRDEAAQLDRAAERFHRMAAAIADGREDEIVEAALSVGRGS